MRERAYVFAAVAATCLATGCRSTSTSATRIEQPPPAFVTQSPATPPAEASAAPDSAGVAETSSAAAANPQVSAPQIAASAPQSPVPPVFEERHAPAAIDTFLDAANAQPETPRPEIER